MSYFKGKSHLSSVCVVVMLIQICFFQVNAAGLSIHWTGGGGDGAWNNAANWTPTVVPGPGDEAYIDLNGTYTVTAGTVAVSNLVVGAVSGEQTLVMAESSTLNGSTIISKNGILSQTGGSIDGTVLINGQYQWQAGDITGAVTVGTEGVLQVVNAGEHNLYGAITNQGTLGVDGGQINNYGTLTCRASFAEWSYGDFYNNEGGVVVLETNMDFGGMGLINDRGTLLVPANSGVRLLNAYWIDLAGTCRVETNSSLAFGFAMDNGVTVYLRYWDPLTLEGAGTTVFNSQYGSYFYVGWYVTGTVRVQPEHTVQLETSVENVLFEGGGTLNLAGDIGNTLTAAPDMRVNLLNGYNLLGTFVNQGVAICNGSMPGVYGVWQNSGRLTLQNGSSLLGYGTITNEPAGIVESGSGTNVIECAIQNSGILQLQSGTLGLAGVYAPGESAEHRFPSIGTSDAKLECVQPFTAAGALTVQLAEGFTPSGTEVFPIISYPSCSGQFSLMTLPELPGRLVWLPRFGASEFSLSMAEPPYITAPLQNVTAIEGYTATISVSATGTSLAYQWKKDGVDLSNGSRISGVNSSRLTISDVVPADAGAYTVVLTNEVGTSTSSAAILSVAPPLPMDIHWTGAAGDGAWTNLANWDSAFLPFPKDTVFIDLPGTYTVTVSEPICVSNLVIGATSGTQRLVLPEGSVLTAGTIISSNGILSQAGGRVEGAVNVYGRYSWQSGELAADLTVDYSGILEIAGTNSHLASGVFYSNGKLVCPAENGEAKLTVTGTNQFELRGDCRVETNSTLWIESQIVGNSPNIYGTFSGAGVTRVSGIWDHVEAGLNSGSRVEMDGVQITGILEVSGWQGQPRTVTFKNTVFSEYTRIDYGVSAVLLEGCSTTGNSWECAMHNYGTFTVRAPLITDYTFGTVWNYDMGVLVLETNITACPNPNLDVMNYWGTILVPANLGEVQIGCNALYFDGGTIRVETNSVLGFGGDNAYMMLEFFSGPVAFEGEGKTFLGRYGAQIEHSYGMTLIIAPEHTVQVEDTYLGDFVISGGGTLNLAGWTEVGMTVGADMRVNLFDGLIMEGACVNYGTATCLGGSVNLNPDATWQNCGRLVLGSDCRWLGAGTITNAPGGVIESKPISFGTNLIQCTVQNGGILELQPGTLRLEGVYTPSETAECRFLATGTNGAGHAALDCAQPFTAKGELKVELSQDFNPAGAQAFPLIRYPSYLGQFSSMTLPTLSNGLTWRTQFGANAFSVLPTDQPWITQQPQSQSILAGENVTFTAAAENATSVQWFFGTNPIEGATNTTLTVNYALVADSGSYKAVFANATGSVETTAVTLTVSKQDQTIAFGTLENKLNVDAPFTVSATASSGLPVTFSIVSGPATVLGNTITLSGEEGTVVVRASQAGDDIWSAATPVEQSFAVTVSEVRIISPTSMAMYSGQYMGAAITLSVVDNHTTGVTYQWFKDGQTIAGATASSYRYVADLETVVVGTKTVVNSNFTFSVRVANAVSSVTTNIARINVAKEDGKPPVVALLTPATGTRTQSVVLSGTATEDQNITAMWYWFTNVNQGVTTVTASNNLVGAQGASLVKGSGNAWTWSVPVTPLPGTNSVVVVAINQRGRSSLPVFKKFFYKVGHQIPLTITGDLDAAGSNLVKLTSIIAGDLTAYVGATNPFPSTTVTLWEGQTYTMRITADKGTWYTNTVITAGNYNYDTTSKTFSFQARSNMTITVDLRTNRFTAGLSGLWNGLFQTGSDPGQVTMTNAGALTAFKIDKLKGTYSGKIMLKGKSWPVKGGFSTSGQTTNRIIYINTTTGQSNYIADLQMTLPFGTPDTNTITGLITHATENWSANLKLVRQDTNNFSGTNMTLVIPGATDPAQGPGGYGYAKLAFGPVGSVGFSGLLGDGSKLGFKAAVSTGGELPVFSMMLPDAEKVCQAMLFGWVDLADTTATLTLIKNAGTWTNYPSGFITTPIANYGPYAAPTPGSSPFASAPTLMEIEDGASAPELIYNVALTNANTTLTKLPGSPTNWLSGKIVPLSGTVIGDFGNGWGKTKLKYSLGILQSQNAAYGFYAGTNSRTAPVILH